MALPQEVLDEVCLSHVEITTLTRNCPVTSSEMERTRLQLSTLMHNASTIAANATTTSLGGHDREYAENFYNVMQ